MKIVFALMGLVALAASAQASGHCFGGIGFRSGFYTAPVVAPVVVQQQIVQPVYAQQFVAPVVVSQPVVSYPVFGFSAGYGYGVQRFGFGHGVQRQRVIIRHR